MIVRVAVKDRLAVKNRWHDSQWMLSRAYREICRGIRREIDRRQRHTRVDCQDLIPWELKRANMWTMIRELVEMWDRKEETKEKVWSGGEMK